MANEDLSLVIAFVALAISLLKDRILRPWLILCPGRRGTRTKVKLYVMDDAAARTGEPMGSSLPADWALLPITGGHAHPSSPAPKLQLLPAHYHHVRVTNRWWWTNAATQVRVFLTRMEELSASRDIWEGDVPLPWRYEDLLAPNVATQLFHRTIGFGSAADCDLCRLVKDGAGLYLELLPLAPIPFDLDSRRRCTSACDLRVELVARSVEAESKLKVRIWWDGKWEDDEKLMEDHLKVWPDKIRSRSVTKVLCCLSRRLDSWLGGCHKPGDQTTTG